MWEASPQVFGLRVDVEELLPPERFGFGWDLTPGERILALARGLASSPEWQEMEDAVLVVRVQPPYGLAVIGRFTPDQIPRVRRLPAALTSLLPRFRPVTYREVEEDCALLGERLVETFGRQELHGLAYTGIPRGGLIVLGMLSYVLGLSRERLSQGAAHPGPLVVVDDCALTGRRFGEVLREHPGREVAFAHLYSHPDLRDAIRRRESRVIATPWARDLHDHASDILGPDHEAWVRRWTRRGGGELYWVGHPDHISFPWSEPDLTMWDPEREKEELGWRVAPPETCLKNRFSGGSGHRRVHVQPSVAEGIPLGRATYFAELPDEVVMANLDRGSATRLRGVAVELWRGLRIHGWSPEVWESVAARHSVDPERVREDAVRFVGELENRGLLDRGISAPGGNEVR